MITNFCLNQKAKERYMEAGSTKLLSIVQNDQAPASVKLCISGSLFALDRSVYVAYKEEGCSETNHSEHEEETIADAGHVPEEK